MIVGHILRGHKRVRGDRSYHIPGSITVLTAGLIVARNIALHGNDAAQVAGGIALAAGLDAAASNYAGPLPNTELIVTTSISDGGRFAMRKTDVYYFDEEDLELFMEVQPQITPTRDLKVVGDR